MTDTTLSAIARTMDEHRERVLAGAAEVDALVADAMDDIERGARPTSHRFRLAGDQPPPGWYGIRCLTGKEAEAADEVGALGVEVYMLTYRTRTWPRKKRGSVTVERALCPGYVFAWIEPSQWPQVKACRRVIGWIADERGPLPVARPDELRKFRNAAMAGTYDDTGVEGRLQPGDELEVLFGPFAGWRVAFMALRGASVEGEIAMLGTARKVRIPAGDIHMRKG